MTRHHRYCEEYKKKMFVRQRNPISLVQGLVFNFASFKNVCCNKNMWGGGKFVAVRSRSSSSSSSKRASSVISNKLTNYLEPHAFYVRDKRKVVLHVGPTNSGKTYQAIQRLESADSGFYCAPLRLLAWEIFDRFITNGVPCDLVTGNEKQRVEGSMHVSSTVEMCDLGKNVDVAVLDEIQMIADKARGWAWTRAFHGLRANELHACGDPCVVPLLEKLCEQNGDDLEVIEYDRLSPLTCSDVSVPIEQTRPGDCVVAFNRTKLYDLKKKI